MDNLTHSLTGYALARAGLDRFSPRAGWLLIFSANAPDLDIVYATRGALPYFEAHRGYTHSLAGMPFMALLSVLVVAGIFRQKLPWWRAWGICLAGVASHLLLDLTNSYGIRLLLPLSSRWFHLDLNSLYDGWILVALLLGVIGPLLSWLVNREIGDRSPVGRSGAFFALGFFLLFDAGRSVLHNRSEALLESRVYEGAAPLQVAALPEACCPQRWTGVVETQNAFEVLPVDSLRPLDTGAARSYFKPQVSRALAAAVATEPFRYLRYFARFPVWSQQPIASGARQFTRVEMTDLRFGEPGAGSFHAVALVDEQNRVVGDWFTFGSGAELGYGEDGSAR